MRRFVAIAALLLLPLLVGCGVVDTVGDTVFGPSPTPTPPPPRVVPQYPTHTETTEDDIDKQLRESARAEQEYLEEEAQTATGCVDVTTIDSNWDNDMLCTRSDGSQFYMDYEGAARFN